MSSSQSHDNSAESSGSGLAELIATRRAKADALRDRGVDFHVHLLGDGPMRGELERAIRETRLDDHITLHGLASGEQVSHAPKRGPATEAIIAALKAHRPALTNVGAATVAINLIAIVSSLFAMQVYDLSVRDTEYPGLHFGSPFESGRIAPDLNEHIMEYVG